MWISILDFLIYFSSGDRSVVLLLLVVPETERPWPLPLRIVLGGPPRTLDSRVDWLAFSEPFSLTYTDRTRDKLDTKTSRNALPLTAKKEA